MGERVPPFEQTHGFSARNRCSAADAEEEGDDGESEVHFDGLVGSIGL